MKARKGHKTCCKGSRVGPGGKGEDSLLGPWQPLHPTLPGLISINLNQLAQTLRGPCAVLPSGPAGTPGQAAGCRQRPTRGAERAAGRGGGGQSKLQVGEGQCNLQVRGGGSAWCDFSGWVGRWTMRRGLSMNIVCRELPPPLPCGERPSPLLNSSPSSPPPLSLSLPPLCRMP